MKIHKNYNNHFISSYEELNLPNLPFENNDQISYPKTNSNKLKNQDNFKIDIEHLCDKIKDDYNNYLTIRRNKRNIFLTTKKFNKDNFKKSKSKEDLKIQDFLISKIFPDKKEINKYSYLPFFSL